MRVVLVALFLVNGVYAGSLDGIFDSFKKRSNFSEATSFSDQAAGYYSMGGFAYRPRSEHVQFAQFTPPQLNVKGCGEIDLILGSASFISGEKLVQALQNIGQHAATYFFQLSLKTVAPQVESALQKLRDMAQMINNLSLESCQVAQSLVDAALVGTDAFGDQVCQQSHVNDQGKSDWFGTRDKCASRKAKQDAVKNKKKAAAESDTNANDILVGEYNLVWNVIKHIPEYAPKGEVDETIANFVMTTAGTLIARHKKISEEEETTEYIHIEPMGSDEKYLHAYLQGGKTMQYKCDEHEKCLNPESTEIEIKDDGGLKPMFTRVFEMVISIRKKYAENTDLSSAEKALIADAISVPLLKYIEVSCMSGVDYILSDASNLVAMSVLLRQFQNVLEKISTSLHKFESEEAPAQLEPFKRAMEAAKTRITMKLSAVDHAAAQRLMLISQGLESSAKAMRGM